MAPKTEKTKKIKKVLVDAETLAYWNGVYLPNVHVKGFDLSRPEDDLKRELFEHFSGCGRIDSIVFVSSMPERGFQGYASIFFRNGEEAKKAILDLHKSFMGKVRLSVKQPFSKKVMRKIRNRLATRDYDVLGFEDFTSEDDSVEYVPVVKKSTKKGKRERQAVLEKCSRKKLKKTEQKKK